MSGRAGYHAPMAAYVIGQLRVRDWSWYREYRAIVEPMIARHGGRYLVKGGNPLGMEGEAGAPDALVILEFPSREHAERWYADPAYQPMIELRRKGCSTELLLVDGL